MVTSPYSVRVPLYIHRAHSEARALGVYTAQILASPQCPPHETREKCDVLTKPLAQRAAGSSCPVFSNLSWLGAIFQHARPRPTVRREKRPARNDEKVEPSV